MAGTPCALPALRDTERKVFARCSAQTVAFVFLQLGGSHAAAAAAAAVLLGQVSV
jgi:hypothetical protein